MKYIFLLIIAGFFINCTGNSVHQAEAPKKLKALIIDGQNNHGVWPKTTMMMKDYIEETGLFTVDVKRMKYTYQGPHHGVVDGLNHERIKDLLNDYPLEEGEISVPRDSIVANPDFEPDFKTYDVVISNFGWQTADFTPKVRADFENYMKNGGGLVIVHAANNAWGDWEEFNKMIGLGGWGDRDLKTGYQVYYDDIGNHKKEFSNGEESSHGPEVSFLITTRAPEHPIMQGVPMQWFHTKDELYDRLRGPAENLTVLATAFSDIEANAQPWAPENKGSGRHEPLLMVIDYGEGRIFHTALGHMDYSMESVGFVTTLQRGTEWAATGKVTQKLPVDFPTETVSSIRKWSKK